MFSFEAMRDRQSNTDVSQFPDAEARQGWITNARGDVVRQVPVHLRVRPYLALYPVPPSSARLGGGVGEYSAPQFLPTNENFFVIRVDHQLSERNSLFTRYTFADATSTNEGDTFLFNTEEQSRQQYLTVVGTRIFSPSFLASVRLGYTRPVSRRDSLSHIDVPRSLSFSPTAPQFGQIQVAGLSPFGPDFSMPLADVMNSFQWAGDVVSQRGSHTLKYGLDVHRYRWDVFASFHLSGLWSFNSLESFLQGGPGGTTLTFSLPGSDSRQLFRQTYLGLYLQDAYKVTPRLQVNWGLRYDYATLIHDKYGKTAYLADFVRDAEVKIGPYAIANPSRLNLSPRLGITWSPWGNRNTVLNAGFGIYYDQMLEYVVHARKTTVPFYKRAIRTNFNSSTTFPDAVAAISGGGPIPLEAQLMDYKHMISPMVLRFNVELQQPLPGGWRARAGYVGARGNHLFRGYQTNLFPVPEIRSDGSLFFPPNAGPVNPAFQGGINIISTDAQSFYNALQLSAGKSIGAGASVQANYTYSKSVDDSSTSMGGSPQYGLRRTLDRGLSDFDIRHRLVVNYFYDLPWGSGRRWWSSGVLSYPLGGWRLGGILSFRTGSPFSPQISVRNTGFLFAATRPNLLPGRSNNPVEGVTAGCGGIPSGPLGTRDRYFDPCAYSVPAAGTLGNAGRNTILAPNVFNIDVSLQREFILGGEKRLQFRAEFFNLPNRTNLGPNRGASLNVLTGSAGRIGPPTNTTARQIQFALRFSF